MPVIAAALGAFLLVLQQCLMLTVGLHRANTGIGVGIGSDRHLERKVRRHGNLAENAAIFLIVLTLAELSGVNPSVLIGFAAAFAFARVCHGIAFFHLDGSHNADGHRFWIALRVIGATITALGGVALGVYLAYFLMSMPPF